MSAHEVPNASTGVPGVPDAHGAIDLGAVSNPNGATGAAQTATGGAARAVLVTTLDEQSFGESVQRSTRTPLLLALVSGTPQDQPLVDTLTELVIAQQGRLLLGIVNAQQHPQIAQALRVRTLPTTLALIAGQPVPLFEGLADRTQIEPVISQVLQVAAQQGVTEVVELPSDDEAAETEEPKLTPQQIAAQQALDDGRFADASHAFQRILDESPKDEFARHGLLLSHLRARLEQVDQGTPEAQSANDAQLSTALEQADRTWLAGDPEKAFDVLLQPALWANPDDRTPLQQRLIGLFELTGNTDARVNAARTRLASLLF
ncbi:tetratricopeptide repeat protein [Pseudoclavibacter sp. 13-3]|uniref:tetratricopeptide repeat protein n=1 Tax=Pseudoclavibacter sp. 13-3 TaxID=2901228 RepID=UPI001E485765|nr:tetratricopeptide repeat protein [Pseudoclavibacter sp. 13-3]MCD7100871.1 tetratricopeptide repeat protein [Pseudoclavibacter sp. 13-3]